MGNVTGSNSVNVFLGLGMPWLAATIYWAGIWTGDATGTVDKPGPCRSLDTCVGDENAVRRQWLATYQVWDGLPVEMRPATRVQADQIMSCIQGDTSLAHDKRPYSYRLLTKVSRWRDATLGSVERLLIDVVLHADLAHPDGLSVRDRQEL